MGILRVFFGVDARWRYLLRSNPSFPWTKVILSSFNTISRTQLLCVSDTSLAPKEGAAKKQRRNLGDQRASLPTRTTFRLLVEKVGYCLQRWLQAHASCPMLRQFPIGKADLSRRRSRHRSALGRSLCDVRHTGEHAQRAKQVLCTFSSRIRA
jgi:hypothetical protein